MEKILFYGTLMEDPDVVLRNVARDVTGHYPTIFPKEGSEIDATMKVVSDDELSRYDRYEREGHLYYRTEINGYHIYIGDPDKLGSEVASYEFDRESIRNWMKNCILV